MKYADIDSLVDSLFKLGRPVSINDVETHIQQLDNPLDIMSYINRVLSYENLGFKRIITFEKGVKKYLHKEQEGQIEKARERAKKDREAKYIDELTQIPNRRAIEEKMREPKKRYATLMIDIDHFKNYNKKYGHDVGDITLKIVATLIARNVRKTEGFLGRYGGEEIYVQLNNIGKYQATEVAERIRQDVEQNATKLVIEELNDLAKSVHDQAIKQELYLSASKLQNSNITVSVGVADELQENEYWEVRWLADKALGYAKKGGRNRVVMYEPKMSKPTPNLNKKHLNLFIPKIRKGS